MTDGHYGQKFHLLNLPIEIRLEIYKPILQTTPVWFSKHNVNLGKDLQVWHHNLQEWPLLHYKCIRSLYLFHICKQIRVEALLIFKDESPLDLYTQKWSPHQLPEWMMRRARHIICGTETISALFGPEVESKYFDRLWKVTIVDASPLIRKITHGTYLGILETGQNNRLDLQNQLRNAIHTLRLRGVKTIEIRSSKAEMQRRKIVLQDGETGVRIIVSGIIQYWNEKAQARLLGALPLDPRLTEFEFHDEWERTEQAPYGFNIDYFGNALDRDAAYLSNRLKLIGRKDRVSVRGKDFVLLEYVFNSQVYHRLLKVLDNQSCCYVVVDSRSPDGKTIQTVERGSSFGTRDLKATLYRLTGERAGLDEIVTICEFLAVAQGSQDESADPLGI